MNYRFKNAIAVGFLTMAATASLRASIIPALVNFDPPGTAQGPTIYVAVPGPQTIVTTPATFTGGVVLGFATFFPAIAFATAPNVYGSANFGNNLSETLTINIDPTFSTNEVSFALFNGETFTQSYVVNGFNGANLVSTQTLNNIAPNFNSGYGLIDLSNLSGFTSVTIAPTGAPAAWDFLLDTIAFNQSITSIVPTPVVQPATQPARGRRHGHGEVELVEVNFGDDLNDIRGSVLVVPPATTTPEPGTYLLVMAGMVGFVASRRKRQTI